MAHFIRDNRKDLDVEKLPFMIAETYYLIGDALGRAMREMLRSK